MPVYALDSATHAVRYTQLNTHPLLLLCDEPDPDGLPAPLRKAVDQIWLRRTPDLEAALPLDPGPGECGWLFWRRGERLLHGDERTLRAAMAGERRRSFVPVHHAYIGWETLDLIGLEPRLFSPMRRDESDRAREDCLDPRLRIAAAPAVGPEPTGGTEPWQELRAALRLEIADPGNGVAQLAQLAQRPGLHPALHALCLRNLAVALLQQRQFPACRQLLEQARRTHPAYRELDFLAAHLALAEGNPAQAPALLQQATAAAPPAAAIYIGSGGECGYRAHYLIAVLAERTGHQQIAWQHYLTGLRQSPAFVPSLTGLLRQRLSPSMFAAAQWELSRVGRREPQYQRPIFDFFLLHQAWDAARNLLRIWPLAPDFQAELQARLEALSPLYRPEVRAPGARCGVVLSGAFWVYSSVARINRYLAAGLAADPGLDLALEPSAAGLEAPEAFPASDAWRGRLRALPRRLDLTIRHGWPPVGSPPPTGKLALILPWEFGAIPRAWLTSLRADEFWVPSRFVRDVLVRAGIAPERVAVIPNGFDDQLYRPEGESQRPEGARRVNFLFAGGAIARKGVDVLLAAWREAFTPSDDVSLTIKDVGTRTFYRHLSLAGKIGEVAREGSCAPILYLGEDWSELRLPSLYRGSEVVVLPYRGEGFGLPLLEALACGKPVITTAAGPAPEFCPPEASWFVPAAEVEVPTDLHPPGEMTGPLTWFEPDAAALAAALRAAYEEASRGQLEGRSTAALAVHRSHTWKSVIAAYRERIAGLEGNSGGIH